MLAPASHKREKQRDPGSRLPVSQPPLSVTINKRLSNPSTRSRLPETSKKAAQPGGVVKVIPVSGSMKLPEIPFKVGTATWELLFSNLMNWLPELEDVRDENSVMLQYKADTGWKPLAGNDQLKSLLDEFGRSGWCLYVRCAPKDEFESSSEKDDYHILKNNKQGSGEPVRANSADK